MKYLYLFLAMFMIKLLIFKLRSYKTHNKCFGGFNIYFENISWVMFAS